MRTVVFCRTSKSRDAQLSGILHRNLPDFYHATLVSPSCITEQGEGEELLLLETQELPEASLKNAVFVFGENFVPEKAHKLNGAPLCIAASDNLPLLEGIAGSHPQVITCGMSPKDTFSCSGKSEHSAPFLSCGKQPAVQEKKSNRWNLFSAFRRTFPFTICLPMLHC